MLTRFTICRIVCFRNFELYFSSEKPAWMMIEMAWLNAFFFWLPRINKQKHFGCVVRMIIWVDPARPSHKFNELLYKLYISYQYIRTKCEIPSILEYLTQKQIECAKISVYLCISTVQNAGSFSGVLLLRGKKNTKKTPKHGPKNRHSRSQGFGGHCDAQHFEKGKILQTHCGGKGFQFCRL